MQSRFPVCPVVQTRLVLLLAILSLALYGCGGVKASAPPAKPPEVEVADVVQKDVPMVSEWTATLDGFVNAQMQPRVAGYLVKQNYMEGFFVL
jgi:membrane fusion protein (multidrug efflux system)